MKITRKYIYVLIYEMKGIRFYVIRSIVYTKNEVLTVIFIFMVMFNR